MYNVKRLIKSKSVWSLAYLVIFLSMNSVVYSHNCATKTSEKPNKSQVEYKPKAIQQTPRTPSQPSSVIKESVSTKNVNAPTTKKDNVKRAKDDQSKNSQKEVKIENPSIRAVVDGMVCSFCAQGITKAFENEKSVKKVHVNLDEKSVDIKLKRFRRLSDKKIRTIITDAGYTLNKIER